MKKQTLHDLTNNKWYKFILLLVGISLVFLIWYIISIAISNPLFPGPQVVIPVFFKKTLVLSTYEAIFYTLLRLILSFSISFVIAFIFGILGGLFKTINLMQTQKQKSPISNIFPYICRRLEKDTNPRTWTKETLTDASY